MTPARAYIDSLAGDELLRFAVAGGAALLRRPAQSAERRASVASVARERLPRGIADVAAERVDWTEVEAAAREALAARRAVKRERELRLAAWREMVIRRRNVA